MLTRSLICALTTLAVAAASCSSMHQVPAVRTSAGQPITWQVKAGDTIRVTLRDGATATFKVQRVTPDVIIASNGTTFEHANITSVERRESSSGKTAGAVGAGLGVAYLLVLASVAVVLGLLFGGI